MKVAYITQSPKLFTFLAAGFEKNGVTAIGLTDLADALEPRKFDFLVIDLDSVHNDGELKKLEDLVKASEKITLIALLRHETMLSLKLGESTLAKLIFHTKPPRIKELCRQIKVIARQENIARSTNLIQIGDLLIDQDTRVVEKQGHTIMLTSKEFHLLMFFITNTGKVLTRQFIAQAVWGIHFDTGTNFVDVYVNYLRKKIEKPFSTHFIKTIVGQGYVFSMPVHA